MPTSIIWWDESSIVGPSVIGPGDQTGRPYIRGVDIIELRFDKMSNEGGYNALPRTKIRFGGFGGSSRAIRKIQIDADRGVGTTFRRVLGKDGVLFLFPVPNGPLFITIRFVDSTLLLESETHFFLLSFSKDLTSGRETIVFGRWNYIVWGGKLYCLARETILFRARFVCFSKMKCIVF